MKGRPFGSSFPVVAAWKITTARRTLTGCYYVGLDVHKASISAAVLNAAGKLIMESVVGTSAATVLDLLKGLRGRVEGAGLRRTKKAAETRGLTRSHHRTLKHVFKGAAQASSRCEPFRSWYAGLLAKGLRPELARVTVARKIAAVTLAVWKSGEGFADGEVMKQAA